MEGPGMSLFQGAASIHINNSAQDRLEEQEDIEDEKRRNEELKHKLANAFDDLLDDDEASSVNSSGNFTLEASRNNVPQTKAGLPPTYVESLNHLKENQRAESPKVYNETPKNHITHMQHQEEPLKQPFSPYGAGDGQNNYYQQDFRCHLNGINNYDARQEYMNNEQLKVMYEMRVNECQQLAGQMEALDTEIDSLRAKLAAAINDRDKAELSLQEAHHLLASGKHKLIELEQQVKILTDKLVESDQDKEQLKMELRSANISLQDVQQRLHTMQVSHTHDTDALFREQQDRHREETERLQNDLMKAKSRLEEKENEIKILEKRCIERDREKEELLIEKGATINRLASELEATQRRLVNGETSKLKEKVSQLTSERNAAKEQVKELGSKLEVTAHELVLYRNKLTANQKEYEHWRATLRQILAESVPDNMFLGEPPSPGKLATLKEVLSRYKLQMQKLSSLQEEISKRDKKIEQQKKQESELRAKLEEQKGKEMQLNSRLAMVQNKLDLLGANSDSDLLDSYKKQNERMQHELEETRAELKTLDLKYTELELEHDKLKAEKGNRASIVQEANADLLRELEKYSGQLKDTLKENGELKTLYLQACSSRDTTSRELKDFQSKMQKERDLFHSQEKENVEKIEKQKQQIDKLNLELNNTKEELERANKRISELQREFTDKQKEFTEKLDKYLKDEKSAMRKDREQCSQCEKHLKHVRYLDDQLSKCTIKLASQESNEALMKELKGKAEFFQQYIMDRFKKLREQRTVATNTEESHSSSKDDAASIEQMVQDCDDAIAAKTTLMMKEKAIRDQIAEKFTLEMKTVEMDCARKIKEIENEQIEAITKLKDLLERKAQEVETLKDFILSERSKVTMILESKENEISTLIKDHNEVQADCQKATDCFLEWKSRAEKLHERVLHLEEKLKNERELSKEQKSCAKEYQSMKAKVGELQVKVGELQARVSELKSKLVKSEQELEKLRSEHQIVQEKYKNTKKTVYAYKDYVAKKDAHISNEMNRIQDEYRKIFVKLQTQINYHVNCRIQEERSRGKRSQAQQYQPTDYSERITKISEEFARLAQDRFNGDPDQNSK